MLLAQATPAMSEAPLIWGIILVGIAVVLLFLELFIPSGGILSLCSAVAVLASIIAFFTYSTSAGFIALGAYIVFGPLVIWGGFRWWVSSSIGQRMILGAEDDPLDRTPDEAYAASRAAMKARAHQLDQLIGRQGTAETKLFPVGSIRIDGTRYEALAETGMINAGTEVLVIAAYDNQLKVRPAAS